MLATLPDETVAAIPPVFRVIAKTSPQDVETQELVDRLRSSVLPKLETSTGVDYSVGGITAANGDFATKIGGRLFYFIGAVSSPSFLLLMAVFRSILVLLKQC